MANSCSQHLLSQDEQTGVNHDIRFAYQDNARKYVWCDVQSHMHRIQSDQNPILDGLWSFCQMMQKHVVENYLGLAQCYYPVLLDDLQLKH